MRNLEALSPTGFEIASVEEDDRFQLRRHSDGAVLPTSFSAREIRPRVVLEP